MNICVVGGGKMGLPLACKFAQQAESVVVCDINASIVASINRGECPIDEPGVPELLARIFAEQRICATTDTAQAVRNSQSVVVIVPALLDERKRADLSLIESAAREIARGLQPDTLISFETTVPVGSTRRRLQPLLEKSGLRAGVDFDLAYSPERVKSLHVLRNLGSIPKIVGGVNERSAAQAAAFYARYLGASILNVHTLEASEYSKIAGMVYRDVNIALSNELAAYAELEGLDFEVVRQAANTDEEAGLLLPGIGVGGHCTPVYPYFLIHEAAALGQPARISEMARAINDEQPERAVKRVEDCAGPLRNRNVVVLGVTFRPGVRAHICSPAFLLHDALRESGANILFHDPLLTTDEIAALGLPSCAEVAASRPEVIILNTAHPEYRQLDFGALAARGLRYVLDGRGFFDSAQLHQYAITHLVIGRGMADPPLSIEKRIPLSRPDVDWHEAHAAAATIRTGWLTQGSQLPLLESEFAAYVNAPYACAVSSGTAALHLALVAARIGHGDEVITVSHSFIATANSIVLAGARPVFVDIEPATFNIDPLRVEEAITPRTKAILCVHQLGMPCDIVLLREIAARRHLLLIEDAACAAGSEIEIDGEWQRIGRPHGLLACFSFHPRKLLTCGEGGMITTSDESLLGSLQRLRNHGLSIAGGRLAAAEVGYNYRMNEIQAAMLREQIRKLPSMLSERRRLVKEYRGLLTPVSGIVLPSEPDWAKTNWQSLCARLPAPGMQSAVLAALDNAGIECRPGISNAHQQPSYRSSALTGSLRHSENAAADCIMLPLYPGLRSADIMKIVEVLAAAVTQCSHALAGAAC
jgi:nucleotide sugar dehydrogenase